MDMRGKIFYGKHTAEEIVSVISDRLTEIARNFAIIKKEHFGKNIHHFQNFRQISHNYSILSKYYFIKF